MIADKYFVFIVFKAEDVEDAVDGFGGDVVDDGAVFYGGDYEVFF